MNNSRPMPSCLMQRFYFCLLILGLSATCLNAQPLPSVAIRVKVVDENEKPIPEIHVGIRATDQSKFYDMSLTDAQGIVEFQKPKVVTAKLFIESEEYTRKSVNIAAEDDLETITMQTERRPTSKLLVLDSNSMPVEGAIVIANSFSGSRWLTRLDGKCDIVNPEGRLSGFSIYHPTKAESYFFLFTERNVLVEGDCIVATLDADRKARLKLIDEKEKPLADFIPWIYHDVTIGYPPQASATVALERLKSDESGIVEILGLVPYSQYKIKTESHLEDGQQRLEVIEQNDETSFQQIAMSEESIKENHKQLSSEFLRHSEDEIEASKWWNSPALLIGDQQRKVVILQKISKLSSETNKFMNELNWMHNHYSDKGLVAIAVFSAQIDPNQIEKLASEKEWTMPVCQSKKKIDRSALHYLEPAPNEKLVSTEISRENVLRRIRNRMVHDQKSYGRY
jgi:hypothetical protein